MQPQPSSREEAWDEAAGPPIGERISCLDLFVHYNVRAPSYVTQIPLLLLCSLGYLFSLDYPGDIVASLWAFVPSQVPVSLSRGLITM